MSATDLQRVRSEHGHHRVTFVELFFDLVFVFAITQLSHRLLAHLDVAGALQSGLLLLAVWWAWINTSWVTNWIDPEKPASRIMLFALMVAGLVMSSAIPRAWEDRALWFAGAFVASQLIRDGFMLWAMAGHNQGNYRNFQRIGAWHALAGAFWLAGGVAQGGWRTVLWSIAVTIDCIGPIAGFWTPGLGRSTTADWNVEGGHMAERCGLFIIIALGESILVTGATFADLAWTPTSISAFGSAIVGSIAMWWIYFNIGADRARDLFAGSDDPGRIARFAYTYLHLILVAGIIVGAVGDELILKHPEGHAHGKEIAVLTGAPALFVLGNLLFKWATAGWVPLSHMAGLAALAILAAVGGVLSPLVLGWAATGLLVMVALWETVSLGGAKPSQGAH